MKQEENKEYTQSIEGIFAKKKKWELIKLEMKYIKLGNEQRKLKYKI